MSAGGVGERGAAARDAPLPVFNPWGRTRKDDDPGSTAPDDPDAPDRGEPKADPGEGGATEAGRSEAPAPGEDPAGFLRQEAVPMLTRLIRRLELSGHAGTVQDLLDLPTAPALRLLVWPRTPVFEGGSPSIRATLEVEVEIARAREPTVVVQYWHGTERSSVVHVARLPADVLSAAWLWDRLLDGLRQVLAAA